MPEAPLRLSEENLRILESMTESDIPNKMDMGVTTSERARNRCPSWQASFSDMNQDVASVGSRRSLGTTSERARKRAPSRQASFSDTNQDTASVHSQKSSGTIGFYRYQILDRARIYVCNEPPPNAIQSQMDIIFKRKVPEERKHELVGIAKDISQKFINVLRGAHREDDLVELIYEALRSMYKDDTFGFPRKAGIVFHFNSSGVCLYANLVLDWDPSLIPNIQQEFWDIHNIGINPTMRADDTVDRPSKRQQTNLSYLSPGTSQSTMPLPAPPLRSKQEIIVKCPRPDFTIGLRHATVANALIKRGLSNFKANDFIKYLQRERELCSDPTQNFLDVRFPILVIEGKAYATGKTVFEAQNQAAVSGSCMINLQQKLADLSKSIYPESERSKAPLAFSICMQGPHIEFWVHYSLSEDKVRMHYMNIFKTCYGSLQGGLEDFLMDLERLMSWTNDGFLENVAGQLFNLANHAAL